MRLFALIFLMGASLAHANNDCLNDEFCSDGSRWQDGTFCPQLGTESGFNAADWCTEGSWSHFDRKVNMGGVEYGDTNAEITWTQFTAKNISEWYTYVMIKAETNSDGLFDRNESKQGTRQGKGVGSFGVGYTDMQFKKMWGGFNTLVCFYDQDPMTTSMNGYKRVTAQDRGSQSSSGKPKRHVVTCMPDRTLDNSDWELVAHGPYDERTPGATIGSVMRGAIGFDIDSELSSAPSNNDGYEGPRLSNVTAYGFETGEGFDKWNAISNTSDNVDDTYFKSEFYNTKIYKDLIKPHSTNNYLTYADEATPEQWFGTYDDAGGLFFNVWRIKRELQYTAEHTIRYKWGVIPIPVNTCYASLKPMDDVYAFVALDVTFDRKVFYEENWPTDSEGRLINSSNIIQATPITYNTVTIDLSETERQEVDWSHCQ